MSGPSGPVIGRTVSMSQVLDEESGARVGFVERARYDDGRVIYWVRGLDGEQNLGYILPNGRAYKFLSYGGHRLDEPDDLGADVRAVGARRILGLSGTVRLEPISLEALARENDPPAEKAAEPEPDGDGESEEE